jgi:hypothetical protein
LLAVLVTSLLRVLIGLRRAVISCPTLALMLERGESR